MRSVKNYCEYMLRKNLALFLVGSILVFLFGIRIEAQKGIGRPKVGLALSGGGSLGMAHVGVLKVMEEAGLRPDMISGVSMGSIIGGMYAIGYSPDSLHSILKNTDWSLILSNNIPENKVIFTEKYNFNNSAMSLPITSKKIRLPSGLINGQQIESMLSYYAWPAVTTSDFSKLPIPFICLATDIKTIGIVDFTHGYLPDAMRASMAVPSIFTPVVMDTAVLIDGGLLRNIAIGELKEMGADIVIGSYTGFHPYSADELESMTGILKQIGFLNSISDYGEQKKMADVIIEPYMKGISSTVFSNVDSIIQRGYKAALPYRDYFAKLADSLDKISPQTPLRNLLGRQSYKIDRIDITGNDVYSDDQITGVLGIKPGIMIDKDMIKEKIDLLYGKAWFEKVRYRLVPENDSLALIIDCVERPNTILYGSVHYDNTLGPGIILNLSSRNFLGTRNITEISTYISEFYRIRLQNTLFLDKNQKLGLTASLFTDNTMIPVITHRGEMGQIHRRNLSIGASLDKTLGLNSLMSLAAKIENLDHIPKYFSVTGLERIRYNYWSAEYLYQLNTLDNKHFPKKGNISRICMGTSKLFSGDIKTSKYNKTYSEEYPEDFLFKRGYSISGSFRHYIPTGSNATLSLSGTGLLTLTQDSVLSPNNYFYLGGTISTTTHSLPMTGFHPNEIITDKLARIGVDADIEVAGNLYLSIMTDIAVAHETGTDKKLTYLAGYGAGAGYLSVVGPVKIGIMYGLSSTRRYLNQIKGFISLGYSF